MTIKEIKSRVVFLSSYCTALMYANNGENYNSQLLSVWPWLYRYLEEGDLDKAASQKQRIEDLQRVRRKRNKENNIKQETRFFKSVLQIAHVESLFSCVRKETKPVTLFCRKVVDANHRERWVSNNTYWELRRNPGFINIKPTVTLW